MRFPRYYSCTDSFRARWRMRPNYCVPAESHLRLDSLERLVEENRSHGRTLRQVTSGLRAVGLVKWASASTHGGGRAQMWRRCAVWGVLAWAVLALAGPASAATPQHIYRDYTDNGRLDHKYSQADLRRAQRDAALQGYPHVGVQGAVEQALGAQGVKASGGLPFTGLDLALLAAGGGLLLIAGTGLRKLGKAKNN